MAGAAGRMYIVGEISVRVSLMFLLVFFGYLLAFVQVEFVFTFEFPSEYPAFRNRREDNRAMRDWGGRRCMFL